MVRKCLQEKNTTHTIRSEGQGDICIPSLNFFYILARKPNLEKNSIYSNKFCNNFHLSRASGKWVSAESIPVVDQLLMFS